MVFLVFQSVGASAHPPDTGANEYNHARSFNGGVATASGSTSPYFPSMANDGSMSTYWQSSTTTGWLAVAFPAKAYIDEVHAHFLTTTYPRLSLYLDTSGNGAYETSEKAWSTTSNANLDVVVPTPTSFALGIKITIDAKVGNAKPMIAEFEAYLRTDTDGDGLTNDVESGTVYFYESAAVGLPVGVPDVGSNNTTVTVNRLAGVPFRGLADLTVDHWLKDQLSAVLSYWDGGAWVETPVWDPGMWLTKPTILSPSGVVTVGSSATVRARVEQPSLVLKVEFYVDGVLKNETSSPADGRNYTWNWDTSGYSGGPHTLKVRSHDVWSAFADAQVTVYVDAAPTVSIYRSDDLTIVCPGDTVIITGTASDPGGLETVEFFGTYSVNGATSWGPVDQSWEMSSPTTFTIWAEDVAGNTASASLTVGFHPLCESPPPCDPSDPICIESPGAAAASTASVRPGAGFFLDPGSVAVTGGIGKSASEAGYSAAGSTHHVVVNLTNPTSSMTQAERSGRILPAGIPPDLLNLRQTWRLTVTDWASGVVGSVTAFSIRIEDKTSAGLRDTDADTLADGIEARSRGTSPIAQDTDVDGLTDDYEVTGHSLTVWNGGTSSILTGLATDPTRWDTDADGLADGQERGFVPTGQSKVIGEVGQVRGVTPDAWTTVYLRNRYTSPVVIAEPSTFRDSAFGHVRVGSVTDHTLQLKIEKWVAGGTGAGEDVAYLVVEAGDHVLPDGSLVEAGTAAGVGTSGVAVTFREPFPAGPYTLVQTQGVADATPVIAKRQDASVSASKFNAYLNANGSAHLAETVGYVAISYPADDTVLATWTRTTVGFVSATGTWEFPANFSAPPLVLGWMRGSSGFEMKNIGLRLTSVTNASASLYREQTGSSPPRDTIEFFAFAGPMNLTARMTTRPNGTGAEDTDADGLTDGVEVRTYGSSPVLKDTDADGLADKDEVTDRTITIPVNGTARTFTFKTSPTSDDTDADGVKDPDELAGVLDHRVLFYDMSTTTDATHLRDLSGNGGVGSILSATCSSSVAGRLGSACSFSGGAARINVPDSPLVDLTSSLTVRVWVYPTTTGQPSGAGIVAKGTGGGGEAYAVDLSGGVFRAFIWKNGAPYTAQGTTSISANTWYLVTAVFDGPSGALRLYVNAALQRETTGVPSTLATNDHALTIGSREASSTSGYNLGFVGRIDEVEIYDRPLAASEVAAYYAITNGGSPVAWFDMDTLDSSNNLFDFSGTNHPGGTSNTKSVEGRTGFARSFAGGDDGVPVGNSGSASITSGVTVDAYVLLSSRSASDVSVVARKGQFYLNLTSDGRLQWTLYKSALGGAAGLVTSPLPVALNRWVRISATAWKSSSTASLLTVYVDGAVAGQAWVRTFPISTSVITVGYAEGQAHLVGAIDEVLVLSSAIDQTSTAIQNRGARGILLNPSATDTDFDGLADGQELVVRTVKTPKRYPIPSGALIYTDTVLLALGAPAWAISGAQALVGVTHPDMNKVGLYLGESRDSVVSRWITLRVCCWTNVGEVNSFTSYDLFALGFARQDLAYATEGFLLDGLDGGTGKVGQLEYLQVQVTVHTLPNRADSDGDGLNDYEEANLGSDGFATNPWSGDTDADGVTDGLESNGWSRDGSSTRSDASGFKTDPTRADTDRDGHADNADRYPLDDIFVKVTLSDVVLPSARREADSTGEEGPSHDAYLEPFAGLKYQGQAFYSPYLNVAMDGYFWSSAEYYVNVPDDGSTQTFTVELWDYDFGVTNPDPIDLSASSGMQNSLDVSYVPGAVGSSQRFDFYGSSTGLASTDLYATRLTVYLTPVAPVRASTYVLAPLDYAGLYNVTDANGNLVSRRYVGEPRFVALTIEHRIAQGFGEVALYLVPRSIFHDTQFADLLEREALPSALADALSFSQNGTTSSNSDPLQMVLAGHLGVADLGTLEDLLTRNVTGNGTYRWIVVTPYLPLFNLPDDAIRLAGYVPFPHALTVNYTWDIPTQTRNGWTIWDQIWYGIVAVFDEVLTWIESAVVFVLNIVDAIVDAIVQFGSWLWNSVIAPAAQVVASAVQAAAKVVEQLASWVESFFVDAVRALFENTFSALRALMMEFSLSSAAGVLLARSDVRASGGISGSTSTQFANTVFLSQFATLSMVLSVAFVVALMVMTGLLLAFPFVIPVLPFVVSSVVALAFTGQVPAPTFVAGFPLTLDIDSVADLSESLTSAGASPEDAAERAEFVELTANLLKAVAGLAILAAFFAAVSDAAFLGFFFGMLSLAFVAAGTAGIMLHWDRNVVSTLAVMAIVFGIVGMVFDVIGLVVELLEWNLGGIIATATAFFLSAMAISLSLAALSSL